MISFQAATEIVLREGGKRLLGTEKVFLSAISGRICASAIQAPISNQPFDNSAMDGYALRSQDIADATNDNPVTLMMIGHLAAGGEPFVRPLTQGECYEIMTGAPVPSGCDTVVPVEKTLRQAEREIRFQASAVIGDNIRRAGADFMRGDKVLEKGVSLETHHILALATLGIGEVEVIRRPKAGLLSTGMEVVDDFKASLKRGQIYNSTKPYLEAAMKEMGMEVTLSESVQDDHRLFKECLLRMADQGCEILLSTGAVSAGVHDFVPQILKEMGAEIFFHGVAIRPGKPIIFARLPNGGPLFFGLPGNPVSTAVGLRFFVMPALRAMQGIQQEVPGCAVLSQLYEVKKPELCFFMRGVMHTSADGINQVTIPKHQQSFMVSPFVHTNVWVKWPKGLSVLNAGEVVEIYQ
jgi:molybdopterin molybdotransferase